MFQSRRVPIFIATALLCAVGTAYAGHGKRFYSQGQKAERKADLDAAFAAYKQAHQLEPSNAKFFTAYTRMRFQAAVQHIHNGQALVKLGSLPEAVSEFQHAVEIDSSSFQAQQELRHASDLLRRRERPEAAPKLETIYGKLGDGVGESVELKPLSSAPLTLRITADSDVVYRTICKLAGLNVITDPDFRPQKITVDLTDVTIREALDVVRLQSKTFWRPVTSKTILVAADTPTKRKELEQNVMQTFYLRNIATPNELQEAANMVRQLLDVTRVQLLQAQDAIVLRGTRDQMLLAEKLLSEFDQPKSEVMINVAVMEVNRDRLTKLGNAVSTSASWGLSPTSGGGAGTASGNSSAYNIGNFSVSAPGGTVTALASDSNTRLLQNPELRALNDEKATLRIGDRVPIATGSFSAGTGGAGINPLVSTQFQYLDVGVNIDITPHIHGNGEVTLKMVLEISSVTGTQDIGGITQPVIGQRRIEHSARLADGDVNLLGGILTDSDTQSLSGYPWLSKIPILKYLFAQESKERRENEIVFAITPHIVRSQMPSDESLRAIEVGTGNTIELPRRQLGPAGSAAPARPPERTKPQPPAAQPRPGQALPPAAN